MIIQVLLSYKDCTIFFIEGFIGEKKGQIRFPNLKGVICTQKVCNRKYRTVFSIKS